MMEGLINMQLTQRHKHFPEHISHLIVLIRGHNMTHMKDAH